MYLVTSSVDLNIIFEIILRRGGGGGSLGRVDFSQLPTGEWSGMEWR